MKSNKYLLVLLTLLALNLAACPSSNKTTGDKVGDAIENTGDALKEAGEEVVDETKDATNEVKDEIDDASH